MSITTQGFGGGAAITTMGWGNFGLPPATDAPYLPNIVQTVNLRPNVVDTDGEPLPSISGSLELKPSLVDAINLRPSVVSADSEEDS